MTSAGPKLLSMPLLAVIAAIALGLAAVAPLYYLILFDLTLVQIVNYWTIGGIRFDPTDLVLIVFIMALVVRGRFSPIALARKLPYLFVWLLLGTFMTLSYVYSPLNSHNLTDPVRIVYQVYRYCWKPLLYFPLCLMVIRDLKQARHAWMAILIGANVCAVEAVRQGYGGAHEPTGPFETGNTLGAVLVVPFAVAVSGMVFPSSRAVGLFSAASAVLLARAILFSGSRGGMVSVMLSAGVLGVFALLTTDGRRRILKLLPVAIVSVMALLAVRPDIFERATVRHAFTLFEGTRAANMQWRITQRWPHFLDIAIDHPLIGTGTDVDPTLSKDANTPHNGYLALAVKYGFPVLGLFLFFMLRLLLNCRSAFRRSRNHEVRIFHLTMAAAILGVAAHNAVDATLVHPVVLKYFWLFCALAAAYRHLWQQSDARAETAPGLSRPGRQLAPARQLA